MIILLPDDENTLEGPATLYMVPREALNAWVKITPELNEAMEKVRKLAFSKAFQIHPEKMKKFMEGDDSQLDDDLFESIIEDPQFSKVMTTINIAALIDYRNTLGHEEFDKSYRVSDPDIMETFVAKSKWKAFDSHEGWSTGEEVNNKVHYDKESGNVSVDSLD